MMIGDFMENDFITPTNLYKGLDKEIKYDIDMALSIILNTYNNSSDLLVRNYIANNLFTFIISIISDSDKQQEFIKLYEIQEKMKCS